jgi:hypothetical protein
MTTLLPVRPLNYSKDPCFVTLETDSIADAVPARYTINFQPNFNPVDGDTLNIFIQRRRFNFIFKSVLSNDPSNLSLRNSGMSDVQYSELLVSELNANIRLWDIFTVKQTANPIGIALISLTPDQHIVGQISTSCANLDVQFYPGSPRDESVRGLIRVDTFNHSFIKRMGAFDLDTKQCQFNIQEAFSHYAPHLPALNTDFSFELAASSTDTFTVEYLQLDDTNGYQKAKISEKKNVIYGKTAEFNAMPESNSPICFSCHYRDEKTIHEYQPDFFYVYFKQDVICQINCYPYDSDGTMLGKFELLSTPVDFRKNELWAFGVGHFQLKNLLPPTTIRYNISVESDDGTSAYIGRQFNIRQLVDDCIFLLHSNGIGGCETIAYAGENTQSIKNTQEIYKTSTGNLQKILTEQTTSISLTTLFAETNEVGLFLADAINESAWLVGNTFQPVIIVSDTLQFKLNTANLHYSSIEIRLK